MIKLDHKKRLFMVLVVFTVIASCGPGSTIQVPADLAAAGRQYPPPVIQIQNIDISGTATPQVLTSTTFPDPWTVVAKADHDQWGNYYADTQIIGLATDNNLGVQFFRIQITDSTGFVDADISAQQSLPANRQVLPTLGIAGSGGQSLGSNSGSVPAGAVNPLTIYYNGSDFFTMNAWAFNFSLHGTHMVETYICPKCKYEPGSGGPIGVGIGTSPSGGTGCSAAPRKAGPFSSVSNFTSSAGSTVSSPDNSWSATIQQTTPANSAFQFNAILKSGTSTQSISFDRSTISPSLQPPVGGVAFSTDSSKVIVATYNLPAMNIAQQVTFQFADKSYFNSPHTTNVSTYETDPSAGPTTSPLDVEPQLFLSPDSSVAFVLGAPVAGTPTSKFSMQAYDLKNMHPLKEAASNTNTTSAGPASVVIDQTGCKVLATISNPSTTYSYVIP